MVAISLNLEKRVVYYEVSICNWLKYTLASFLGVAQPSNIILRCYLCHTSMHVSGQPNNVPADGILRSLGQRHIFMEIGSWSSGRGSGLQPGWVKSQSNKLSY